jgi:hypothetical protein
MMEYWNIGLNATIPTFHHSITPFFMTGGIRHDGLPL